ncbi:MAG: hypothetical protein KF906_08480 [Actinobacteria bacterium]|nr:hypothetical protein [Actinomycetota bacterium]
MRTRTRIGRDDITKFSDLSGFDRCAAEIDRVAGLRQRRLIGVAEQEGKIADAIAAYLSNDRPEDDFDLLVAYARESFSDIAEDPFDGDRTLLDRFDRRIRSLLQHPISRADLLARHDRIRDGFQHGDPSALVELRELCGAGWRDHVRLFMFRENILDTLRLAAEIGAVDALLDAVHPSHAEGGQLGNPELFGGTTRTAAFDLLAVLANRADAVGDTAVDALVELTGYLESAASAGVRLPAHRLTDTHRDRLLTNVERFEELLGEDPFLLPSEDAARIPGLLKSVLWLANDAGHVL